RASVPLNPMGHQSRPRAANRRTLPPVPVTAVPGPATSASWISGISFRTPINPGRSSTMTRSHVSLGACPHTASSTRPASGGPPQLRRWVIISGERRYGAALAAGLPSVSCHFVERELSASELLQEQLVESCLREDLRPVEQARAFRALMDANGWSARRVADE